MTPTLSQIDAAIEYAESGVRLFKDIDQKLYQHNSTNLFALRALRLLLDDTNSDRYRDILTAGEHAIAKEYNRASCHNDREDAAAAFEAMRSKLLEKASENSQEVGRDQPVVEG